MVKDKDKKKNNNGDIDPPDPSTCSGSVIIRLFEGNGNQMMLGVEIKNLKPMQLLSLLELTKSTILDEMKSSTKIKSTNNKGGYDRIVDKLKELDFD